MNMKRFILSTLAVAVFIYLYEWVMHAHVLTDLYNETPQLWRSDVEMQAFIKFGILKILGLAAVSTWIFIQHFESKGLAEGARFGLLIGLLLGFQQFGGYTYLPISLNLALAWFGILVVEGVGMGLVMAATYRA